jgi:hypothetical protein
VNEPPDDTAGDAGTRQAPDEAIGSVADEAVKLFGAFSEWARDHGSDLGEGVSTFARHAADTARDVDEHLATGSAECTYCPICRAVHVVRQASPEVRAHLAVAASSLVQAAAGMLATIVPPDARSGGRGVGVERIDLDADDINGALPEEDDE